MNFIVIWLRWRTNSPSQHLKQVKLTGCSRHGAIRSLLAAMLTLLIFSGMAQAQNQLFDELKRGAEKALRDTMRTSPPAAPSQTPAPDAGARNAPPSSVEAPIQNDSGHTGSGAKMTAEVVRPAYPGRSHRLKVGQSWGGLSYKRTGSNAVAVAGGRVLFKCRSSEDGLDVSAPSPRKGLMLASCIDLDSGAYMSRILDIQGGRPVASSSCEEVTASSVVAWSPQEDYVVLHMADEAFQKWGILNLTSGRTKCLDLPNEESPEIGEFRWTTPTRAIYRGDRCEDLGIPWGELNRQNCNVVSSYEASFDLVAGKLGPKRTVRDDTRAASGK